MIDLTEIGFESQFAQCIRAYFYTHKPKNILETGLYHGNGSTSIIASLIKDIPIEGAKFYSIECNKNNIEIATENLRASKLLSFVTILSGISIPKDLLPSVERIDAYIQEASKASNVKLDHEQDPSNGSKYYQKETEAFEGDDKIGQVLSTFNNKLDFAILDSGGHLGTLEFLYLVSKLTHPCGIALDDTRHIKHYNSREIIKSDPRFEVINDNEEKYGSMIVKFTP